ncbi:SRPBCC family protein [Amycolatopsis magusensis]|uniref:Carbon monoxide dehydrogenase subunit G n=1 Tax=Amycolatopsis magusensis TaxID=882444 RepID=A0ABS4Q0A6_9PSEU|nr:SRPBCC family protein [Amycolatopsis magusensis]MBP2184595.1 carbon monoxide dehydrogenase subunit G [Amycolatopsis magusensis]
MTRWYPLAEADDEFLASAPFRFVQAVDVPADAARVWRVLSADDALVSWSRLITGMDWTSPRPFGVGTTRAVTVGRAATLRERFYRWDEESRMTFTAEASSKPGFRRFAEDMALTPLTGGTRITWTFAIEPVPKAAPLLRLGRPAFQRVTAGWAKGLAEAIGR